MMTRLLYSSIIIATEGRTDTPTKRGSEKAICEAKCDGGRGRARGRGGRETVASARRLGLEQVGQLCSYGWDKRGLGRHLISIYIIRRM